MEKAFEIKTFWILRRGVNLAKLTSFQPSPDPAGACGQYNASPRTFRSHTPDRPKRLLEHELTDTYRLPSAPLKSRLFCMVYEAMLLFGVLFIATWLFSTLLQQRHALYLRGALQDWLFVVLGLYFGWFWTHGGQTLAMKTWHLRLVDKTGEPLRWKRALIRYALCWLWFLPGLAAARYLEAQGWMLALLPALNFVLWAAATRLDSDRQFLHDRMAGTRIVWVPPLKKPPTETPAAQPADHE